MEVHTTTDVFRHFGSLHSHLTYSTQALQREELATCKHSVTTRRINEYWSTNPLMHYASVASRNRFLSIWRFLHFTDAPPPPASSPSSPPPYRLYKVRPVITAVLAACCTNYRPHREEAVDEAMIGFKERSTMKQCLPKNPVKRAGCVQTAIMVTSVNLSVTRGGRVTPPRYVRRFGCHLPYERSGGETLSHFHGQLFFCQYPYTVTF